LGNRSRADPGLGIRLPADLPATAYAGGGQPLDLSECAGPDQFAGRDRRGVYNQPLAFRQGYTLQGGSTDLTLAFQPRTVGNVLQIDFEHVLSPNFSATTHILQVVLSTSPRIEDGLALTRLPDVFGSEGDPRGRSHRLAFDQVITLDPNQTYYLIVSVLDQGDVLQLSGSISIDLFNPQGVVRQYLPDPVQALEAGDKFDITSHRWRRAR
jgi:hypothetical protein